MRPSPLLMTEGVRGRDRRPKSFFPSYTPLWGPYLLVPLGLSLFGLDLLLWLFRCLVKLVRGERPAEIPEGQGEL